MPKILVIADPLSEKPLAVKRANILAQSLGCSLHVANFCFENLRNVEGNAKDFQKRILSMLEEKSKKSLKKTLAPEVNYTSEVVWEKHINKWVGKYAEKHKPLMLIKTGHRSETMLYTPTDWLILRECNAPVLISAPSRVRKSSVIMAALDLETQIPEKKKLNTKIMKQASQLAKKLDKDLHIVYCPPVSPVLRDLGLQFSDEIEVKAKQELGAELKKLASKYKVALENVHVKAGEPEKAIPNVASKFKADILVMGTVGRTKLAGKLIGNTAERILRLARCDVLALKP